jgi:predicted Zn-dependent peptidase
LRRACPLYPETALLSKRLDELYGARLDAGVRKKGDMQIIHVNFEFANEEYIGKSQAIFENILLLAKSMVTDQTGFCANYVNQEKDNLRQRILALINDKKSYAHMRCIEIMCEAEPYGIRELGFVEDIEAIDEKILFRHYKNVLLSSPVDIFICGDADIDFAVEFLKDAFSRIETSQTKYPENVIVKEAGEVKKVVETENIAQGKLCLGFRTKTRATDENYPAMVIFNELFGGGPSSKLFNNVREKLSLAYYVSSKMDIFKGIMTVGSGIEVENFQKAYDEIMLQLNEVKKGNVTQAELSAAVKATVNNIRSMSDSAIVTEDYWLSRLITGTPWDFEEYCGMLQKITAEQVVRAAQDVTVDTIYFLKGKEA